MNKIKVDLKKCIGCGLCVSIAEKVFRMNEEGKSETIEGYEGSPRGFTPRGVEGVEGKVQEAIDSCPVTAISLAKE